MGILCTKEKDSSNLLSFIQISYSLPHFNFIRYCQLSQYPYPKPQLSPNPTSSKNSIGSKRGSPLKFWREGGHPPPLRRTTSMKLVAHLSSQYTSIQEGQIQDLKDQMTRYRYPVNSIRTWVNSPTIFSLFLSRALILIFSPIFAKDQVGKKLMVCQKLIIFDLDVKREYNVVVFVCFSCVSQQFLPPKFL